MYHTIANGEVWRGEIKNHAKDGSFYWVDTTIVPFMNGSKAHQYVAIRADITESKRGDVMLERLAAELVEQSYRWLLEAAPDAMVVVNQDGEIVLLNVQAEKQFGYRRDEIVGQKVTNIIPEGFAERLIADATRSAAEASEQQIDTGIELRGRRKDGGEFPIEIMLSPLESAGNVLVTAAIRDISARKKAEGELKASNDLLIESNLELEAFTYTAAHDLRAPLRHMLGFASLLHEAWYDKLEDEARRFLDKISTSSKEMGLLLDDLLNFSRLGRVDVQRNRICLSALVTHIQQELEPELRGRVLTWAIGELPEVWGDATLLRQVLFNLISNAAKYTSKRDDARIEIGSRKDTESSVTIFVRDNGAGFEMEYADKLFQVFQRLHKAQGFEGTGIGLAIVKRIVERHGGRVWAEGVPGEGATFYFSLPAQGTIRGAKQ